MTQQSMTLEDLISRLPEIATDGYTDKKDLLETLNKYPDLSTELSYLLSLSCNAEWVEQAKEGNVSFNVYNDSWKSSNPGLIPNRVQLTFVGKKNVPTVSIDIHRKPV